MPPSRRVATHEDGAHQLVPCRDRTAARADCRIRPPSDAIAYHGAVSVVSTSQTKGQATVASGRDACLSPPRPGFHRQLRTSFSESKSGEKPLAHQLYSCSTNSEKRATNSDSTPTRRCCGSACCTFDATYQRPIFVRTGRRKDRQYLRSTSCAHCCASLAVSACSVRR
jgi:hypothetical protein